MDTARYPVKVFWYEEDHGFIAEAPDLPGCSAFGETQAKALSELQDAVEAWVEAARKAGNPIPEPSHPSVDAQPGGKLLLRMPRSLHADLVQWAKRDNVSLNHYIVYLLTARHTQRVLGDFWRWYPMNLYPMNPIPLGPQVGITEVLGSTASFVVSDLVIYRQLEDVSPLGYSAQSEEASNQRRIQ